MKKCKNHKQNQKLKFLKEYVNSGFSFKMSILRDSNQQTFLMQIWNSLKRRIFDFISIWEWDCIVSEIQPFMWVKYNLSASLKLKIIWNFESIF